MGGFEYESVRSFRYSVKEMHEEFIKSEYGGRQRLENKGKDLSIQRFRGLICPSMTDAKQRDTADEIEAEFKHCLSTWDVGMRKNNQHVRAEIVKCSNTDCPQHKSGTSSADCYAKASRTTSQFLAYLLCPQIQRPELAVKVYSEESNFNKKMEEAKAEKKKLQKRKKQCARQISEQAILQKGMSQN